jgi:hypothetical protein
VKHPSCRYLYDYWNRLRAGAVAARRGDIEPAEIRPVLGDAFILEVLDSDTYRFRLAGTRICSVYCKEMKGLNFVDLWSKDDRRAIGDVMTAIARKGVVVSLGFNGHSDRGQTLGFEAIILPLRHIGPTFDRILGAIGPAERPYWLGVHPVVRQELTSLRLITPEAVSDPLPGPAPAAPPGPPVKTADIVQISPGIVRRGAFLVHEGGKH